LGTPQELLKYRIPTQAPESLFIGGPPLCILEKVFVWLGIAVDAILTALSRRIENSKLSSKNLSQNNSNIKKYWGDCDG
jgi:hypothetical protein